MYLLAKICQRLHTAEIMRKKSYFAFCLATLLLLCSSNLFAAGFASEKNRSKVARLDDHDAQSALTVASRTEEQEPGLGQVASSLKNGPLTASELESLLEKRLPGTMGLLFYHLADMYLIPIQAKSNEAISLKTNSERIGKTLLHSPFPAFYRPTLRQFLDEIAWQTKSRWQYDPVESFDGDKVRNKPGNKNLVVFEFVEADRVRPYELNPAKDWVPLDRGNWTMYSPSGSPVSLDVYEMGSYSAQDRSQEPELLKKVSQEVALVWAKRITPRAKAADFTESKVGPFHALFFEARVKTQAKPKRDVTWRQWVFMDGQQCYFIVSTIFPESEQKILPEVEAMLKSFRTKH